MSESGNQTPARQGGYEFGPFRLDATERVLLRDGQPYALPLKVVETLLALVERTGHVVTKEELLARLWPDSFVEEANLTQNIYLLRKALSEGAHEQRYIETIPKRGYRFTAEVRELSESATSAAMPGGAQLNPALPVSETPRGMTTSAQAEPTEPEQAQLRPAPATRRSARLRLIAIACALGGLVAAAIYLVVASRSKPVATGAAVRSIAVLPFKPIGAAPRDEILELGMADTLITRLSNLRRIVVRPTSAVRKYTGLEQDPVAAGREMKVDAVLEGSVQRTEESIRVTVRLVNIRDGASLWAGQFDQKPTDIFAVQDAISTQVAQALTLELTGAERQRLAKRYTENTAAYQLYLQGRYFFNKRTLEGLEQGIARFRQAIEKDPAYALAYAGLADCHAMLGAWQIRPPNESFSQARTAAEKALMLDDSLAEAHTSLAFVKTHSGDWSGAEAAYKRALELNPNYETAHRWYGFHLMGTGRLEEALVETRRAQELDPRSLPNNTQVGRVFYQMRQYDQAIAQYRKTLEIDPNYSLAHLELGWVYEQKNLYEEAIAEYRKAIALGGRPTFVSRIGRSYALAGKRSAAQKVLDELQELAQRSYVSPSDLALIYAGLGEREQAIIWLEKAYEGSAGHMGLKVDPTWDGLRSHPRFQDLLQRMNFPP